MEQISHVDADERFESGQSFGIARALITFTLCVMVASLSFVVAVAMGRKVDLHGIGNAAGIAIFWIVGSAFLVGGVAAVLFWICGWSWSLEASPSSLSWSTPRKTQRLASRAIASIAIRYEDGFPAVRITALDGQARGVPLACLFGGGDLTRLCTLLRVHCPWIDVTYNWLPTCEVCGKLAERMVEALAVQLVGRGIASLRVQSASTRSRSHAGYRWTCAGGPRIRHNRNE